MEHLWDGNLSSCKPATWCAALKIMGQHNGFELLVSSFCPNLISLSIDRYFTETFDDRWHSHLEVGSQHDSLSFEDLKHKLAVQ